MRSSTFLSTCFLTAGIAFARPAESSPPSDPRSVASRSFFTNAILFNALAYSDPSNPAHTVAHFEAYVSLRTPDLGIATAAVTTMLSSMGIAVGDGLRILQQRVSLLSSVGIPGKSLEVVVPGCSERATLPRTSVSDLGLASGAVSLGSCIPNARELEAFTVPGFLDKRVVTGAVFPSPNSGFGVISDIDDTIKVSNVLDTKALLRSTFLEEPKAVPGMPELYSSLAKSLQSPQFVYVSGSPHQLYPFLNKFVDTTFVDAKGPILLKPLTVDNMPQVIKILTDPQHTIDYKTAMIDRVADMYSQKKWVLIGDSGQQDPEIYAAAYKKRPEAIACIWIRRVESVKANNTDARFGTAFEGIPVERFRVFDSSDIPSMTTLDVAGGHCI